MNTNVKAGSALIATTYGFSTSGFSTDTAVEIITGAQLETAFEKVKKTGKRPSGFLVNTILDAFRKKLPEGNDLIATAVGLYAKEKHIKPLELKTDGEKAEAKVDCIYDLVHDLQKNMYESERWNLDFEQNLIGKLNQCFADWLVSEEKKKT